MGPLHGLRVLEFGSIGPGPFAGMLLARMGAEVIRLDRPGASSPVAIAGSGADKRGRPSVAVDLKTDDGRALARTLARAADATIEGFRPGVMERLGLGPDVLIGDNPALVYGRMTGYGQNGSMAHAAGHDINYLALSGMLGAMSREGEAPLFPLNLLGDYGGGGMLLAFGLVCGIQEARRSGHGQVVDAAIVDGVAQLGTLIYGFVAAGSWGKPGTNPLDSGAPFYEVYETSDGGFMAVGAIEPQFYAALLALLKIEPAGAPQWDRSGWPALKVRFAAAFRTRSRDEWTRVADGVDACLTPVLSPVEAIHNSHNRSRSVFVEQLGLSLPASAPRFSRTAVDEPEEPRILADTLAAWGVSQADIEALEESVRSLS